MIEDLKERRQAAFTLVELLVAVALMVLLLLLLVSLVDKVSHSWRTADLRINSFQSARVGFERMTWSISQASLNPYWDYLDASSNRRTPANLSTFRPARYARVSDQHFLITNSPSRYAIFFQAPLGYTTNSANDLRELDNMLNAVGYFVEFNSDEAPSTKSIKPTFLTGQPRWRFRLMELLEPAELLKVFTLPGAAWIQSSPDPSRFARPVAENVIALIPRAQGALGNALPPGTSSYLYDSRNPQFPASWNQLPARVQITMVVMDEDSAARLAAAHGASAPPLVSTSYFQNPANFDDDLAALESDLKTNQAKINYRIFTTSVRIEASKWSED
jgi:uncharacterized protein (TIGR02599 family)